jgi:lipoprotein-releasing system permease protein
MAIVAIINMITTLIILILDRTNMIGILKALGTRNSSIQAIFIYNAAIIVGLGLFWGNLIGIGLSLLQQKFEFITLPEADYYLKTAPIELNIWMIVALNVGTLVLTMIMLVIPSFLVARISPVKTIQFK